MFHGFFSIVRHLSREPDFGAENSFFKTFLKASKRKWQDYVYIQCEYMSTKQKIKHLLREENKVKENKIS